MAHITGGGIPENLPRAFTAAQPGFSRTAGSSRTDGIFQLEALVDESTWPEPVIFKTIAARGVSRGEMRGTFNMGIGFTLVVDSGEADTIISELENAGERAWRIGVIRRCTGNNGVNQGVCYA
jgi:phosphoribosylformylglycinamidine cyclo-ligase